MRGRARPPRHLGRLQAGRAEAPEGRRRAGGQPGRGVRHGRWSRSSCPTGWSSCSGAPALRRSHLDQVVAALWPGARGHAARLLRRARAAQRAAGLDPRRPRLAGLAAGLGRRAGPPRHRADGRPRRDRRAAAPALRRARRRPRAGGRGRAALPAALEGRRRRRRWPPSSPSASTPTSSAASPATARTATTSRSAARAASCAPTARAASSASACSRCCWPSARSWRPSAGAAPLLLLDDVMCELDATRRERLTTLLRRDGQAVITTTELEHVPGAEDDDVERISIEGGERRATTRPEARVAGRLARGVRRRRTRRERRPGRSFALDALADTLEPPTLLAARPARRGRRPRGRSRSVTEPVAERDGVLTVACDSAVARVRARPDVRARRRAPQRGAGPRRRAALADARDAHLILALLQDFRYARASLSGTLAC